MFDPGTLGFFIVASSLALAIPGPTVALVISRSLSDGRRVSIPLAMGVGLGTLAGSTAALAGAGTVLLASAAAFTLIKWAGAAYLVYLGIKLFRSEPRPPQLDGHQDATGKLSGLGDGFIVTLLNPKSIVFAGAFIPQFISPETDYLSQAAVLVVIYSGLATLNGLVFALGTDILRRSISRLPVLRWMNRLGGSFLVACGVSTLLLEKPST